MNENNLDKKILVIKRDETKVMTIRQVIERTHVSEKQILYALKTGHVFKTMRFDEVIE